MSHNNFETSKARRNLFRRLAKEAAPTETHELADETMGDRLLGLGISRRGFMQFTACMAAMMGLPPASTKAMADGFLNTKVSQLKPVIYMSFQECTGCLESLVNLTSLVTPTLPQPVDPNDFYPSSPIRIGEVLLTVLSLDYQETLMAAAGKQAEKWREHQIAKGGYILVVDGSIPHVRESGFFVSAGKSGVTRFMEAAQNAEAVVAVGTCASFGGVPHARPNPTGAVSIRDLMDANGITDGSIPLINIPGCPPIAEVICAVLFYYITNNPPNAINITLPPLDELLRPTMFYGLAGGFGNSARSVHTDCERHGWFSENKYAKSYEKTFDPTDPEQDPENLDETRQYCLWNLGCKGPRTHNACTTVKWNQGISYPMKSGHQCIGCSEPNFWDGFYSTPPTWDDLKNHPEKLTEKGFYEPMSIRK